MVVVVMGFGGGGWSGIRFLEVNGDGGYGGGE